MQLTQKLTQKLFQEVELLKQNPQLLEQITQLIEAELQADFKETMDKALDALANICGVDENCKKTLKMSNEELAA